MRQFINLTFVIKLFIICNIFYLGFNAYAQSPDGAPIELVFKSCNTEQCSALVHDKFKLKNDIISSNIVEGETFYITKSPSKIYRLSFQPAKILSIINPSTNHPYVEGRDYLYIKNIGFSIPHNSHIKQAPVDYGTMLSKTEQDLYGVKVTTEIMSFQIAVNYVKNSNVKLITKVNNAPPFKLQSSTDKNDFRITFFGDSVTLGANASSIYTPPNQPGYVELVMSSLTKNYPNINFLYRNNSVGGWSTLNMTSALHYRVLDLKSDLVVLAFGLNSGDQNSKEYTTQILAAINKIHNKYPSSTVLVVSPTRPNPLSKISSKTDITGFALGLKEITKNNKNVLLADITPVWDKLLIGKNYLDLTGNGLNHPNDFVHRVISQIVYKSITN